MCSSVISSKTQKESFQSIISLVLAAQSLSLNWSWTTNCKPSQLTSQIYNWLTQTLYFSLLIMKSVSFGVKKAKKNSTLTSGNFLKTNSILNSQKVRLRFLERPALLSLELITVVRHYSNGRIGSSALLLCLTHRPAAVKSLNNSIAELVKSFFQGARWLKAQSSLKRSLPRPWNQMSWPIGASDLVLSLIRIPILKFQIQFGWITSLPSDCKRTLKRLYRQSITLLFSWLRLKD